MEGMVLKSSLIPRVPNDVQNTENKVLNTIHTLRAPRPITQQKDVKDITHTTNSQQREKLVPKLQRKIAMEEKMIRGFLTGFT